MYDLEALFFSALEGWDDRVTLRASVLLARETLPEATNSLSPLLSCLFFGKTFSIRLGLAETSLVVSVGFLQPAIPAAMNVITPAMINLFLLTSFTPQSPYIPSPTPQLRWYIINQPCQLELLQTAAQSPCR